MKTAYQIKATRIDNNGVRVASNNIETLGDVYGLLYETEQDAMDAIDDIDLPPTTETEIVAVERGDE